MLELLYTHDDFLIINKPPGLAVQGGKGIQYSLINAIEQEYHCKVWLVHRLDQETSGCIIVARSPRSAGMLSHLISSHAIQKTYAVLVAGLFPSTCKTIETPLTVQGKKVPARTLIKKVINCDAHSLLVCTLDTGRLHQIRRHCADFGFPIIGDQKYGNFEVNHQFFKTFGIKAFFLHSWQIQIKEPYQIKVSAPFPNHFLSYITIMKDRGIKNLQELSMEEGL